MTVRTPWVVLLLALAPIGRASEGVAVELLEGPIKLKTWELEKAAVSERYDEPAFAVVVVPAKYSPRGIALDRSEPFVLRATKKLTLPAGEYRLLLRSRGASRLFVDDRAVAAIDFPKIGINGHESVPELPAGPEVRTGVPGQSEQRVELKLDGKEHTFRWEVQIGGFNLRPEPGDPVVAIAAEGKPFALLGSSPAIPFTDEGWDKYAAEARKRHGRRDAQARLTATADEIVYWSRRHEAARKYWSERPRIEAPKLSASMPVHHDVDRFVGRKLEAAHLTPAPLADDDTFLRRVYLDTVGVPPTPAEIAAFRGDRRPDPRARLIDKLLADPRWADHWVSYWQDVLAENPGLLKPTLNNTGPFRWWLHQALRDNLPMDRFATELTLMEGSVLLGSPAGFGVATENDVPMAAKAQVLGKAFLAADMTCARCHDAPSKSYTQEQLFSLAALLEKKPLAVPVTSTVRVGEGARVPAVRSALKAGQTISPAWMLHDVAPSDVSSAFLRSDDPRERVAAILTGPHNERFAQVLANRVWKRFLGTGIVEPADDWRKAKPSHPELLAWLGRELATHDYDLKHVARLILNSHTYQRAVRPELASGPNAQLFASPVRRRLSAEQLVDSLFATAGKEFGCEELNFDPECRMPLKQCNNLGAPRRAWQFAGLANERDRPALALPTAQAFVDTLMAYGWRDARTTSQTERDESPTPLQPLILANGLLHGKVARLSDDSAITALCLEDVELKPLVRKVFDRVLTRAPTAAEEAVFVELLEPGFKERRTGKPALAKAVKRSAVSWANHLSPEATRMKLAQEQAARAGDPPTPRLTAEWRGRMEDMLWALMGSAEFVFVP